MSDERRAVALSPNEQAALEGLARAVAAALIAELRAETSADTNENAAELRACVPDKVDP